MNPREEGPVYTRLGMLCRRANKDEFSFFYKRKKRVLLGLVKAMNFIDKNDRSLLIEVLDLFGLGNKLFKVSNAA